MDLLSLSDPCCVVYAGNNNAQSNALTWTEIGRTEVIKDNLNPQWIKTFVMEYYFESVQNLKFKVFDIDSNSSVLSDHDFIGEIVTSLAEICGSRGQKLAKPLVHPNMSGGSSAHKRGIMIVSAEEVCSANNDDLCFQVKANRLAKMDWFGATDGYYTISKTTENGDYIPVYKSEVIHSNLHPAWAPVTISMNKLCNGDLDRVLQFDCYDWNKITAHTHIGSFQFTVNELLSQKLSAQNTRSLHCAKKKKNMGEIGFHNARIVKKYSFLEYLGGGMQMNLVVAVDWTQSNGDPNLPASLHFNRPNQMNQYEAAIRSIGDILSFYDHDQQFPSFGFGGKLPNGQVSHCFSLNGNPHQPNCYRIDGVLGAYREALRNVALYGPTYFAPVLSALRDMAHQSQNSGTQQYYILLLITDGVINDIDQTLRTLVDLASMPVSIVIVGVGNADFSAMNVLDGDEQRISDGVRYAERDCVQFVPFNKFKNLPYSMLANETLAELPQQVVEFYSKRNIAPHPKIVLPDSHFEPLLDMSSSNTSSAPPQTMEQYPISLNNVNFTV